MGELIGIGGGGGKDRGIEGEGIKWGGQALKLSRSFFLIISSYVTGCLRYKWKTTCCNKLTVL